MGQELSQAVFNPPRRDETYTESSLEGIFWISSQYNHVPAVHHQWKGRDGKTCVRRRDAHSACSAYYTILYCGGNTEDLGRVQAWMKTLKDTLHVDIVCFDYTGYGVHLGEASEKKCFDDVLTVYKHITTVMDVPPERIIVLGKDLGTAVAIHLISEISNGSSSSSSLQHMSTREKLAKRGKSVLALPGQLMGSADRDTPVAPIAGAVLLSPFVSLLSLVEGRANKHAASRAFGDIFTNDKKAGNVACPVFIVHGALDDVIPCKQGRRLASKLPNLWKFLELDDAGHYNLEYADDFLDDFLDFLEFLGKEAEGYAEQTTQAKVEKPSFFVDTTKHVHEFFEQLGLPQYGPMVVQNGFTDMFAIESLQQVDLQGMGVEDQEHVHSILAAVVNLRSKCPTPRTTAPDPPVQGSPTRSAPSTPHEDKSLDDAPRDKERKKKGSRRRHKRSASKADSGSVLQAHSAPELNPQEEEGFVKLLQAMDNSLSLQPLQKMPARWRQSISFATTVSIPYDELENTRTLSKGFFGEVFEGLWRKPDAPPVEVVVRVVSYKRSVFRQFCKEALVLSQLKHQNVINTLGACLSQGAPLCIVLERLDGPLHEFLKNADDLTLTDRIKLAIGIASGLEYLHTRIPAIIHRDLTSRNILLDKNHVPKVADFGLGRPPAFVWMAPEIYLKKAISTKADIYSLGVVLWEIWTQQSPFPDLPAAQVANRAAKEGLRPDLPSDAPQAWNDLVSACWDAAPENRPTASEVLGTLRELSDEVEVLTVKRGMLLDISFLEQYASDDEESLMSPTRPVEEISPLAIAAEEHTILTSASVDSVKQRKKLGKGAGAGKTPNGGVKKHRSSSSFASSPSPDSSPRLRKRRRDTSSRPVEPSYTSLLSYQMRGMINDDEFSDVRFLVGKNRDVVFGHRAVLAARSKHFRMLMRAQPDCSEFYFPKIELDTFVAILTYLYCGALEVAEPKDCYQVVEAAHDLGLAEVVRVCLDYLGDNDLDIVDAKKLPLEEQLELSDALEKISDVETDISSMEETLQALTDRLRNI